MNATACNRRCLERAGPFALSLVLLTAGCSPKTTYQSDVVRPVRTMVVAAGGEPHMRLFPGKAEASKKVELAFQVPGLLLQLPVREGQRVKKDEVIAQLRQEEFQARLAALQGQLGQAEAALRALRAGERREQPMRLEAAGGAGAAELAPAPPGSDPPHPH